MCPERQTLEAMKHLIQPWSDVGNLQGAVYSGAVFDAVNPAPVGSLRENIPNLHLD